MIEVLAASHRMARSGPEFQGIDAGELPTLAIARGLDARMAILLTP